MHEHRAGVALHVGARGLARGDGRRAVVQGGAVGFDRGELGRHRAFGHDDVAGDAARARRQRQRRAVVAGGMRDHAARGLVVGQRPHRVARAAELEGARALQVLGLEVQIGAPTSASIARERSTGVACACGRDARGGGEDVAEGRQVLGGRIHGGNANAVRVTIQVSTTIEPERIKQQFNARGRNLVASACRAHDHGEHRTGAHMIRKLSSARRRRPAGRLRDAATAYRPGGGGDYYYGEPSRRLPLLLVRRLSVRLRPYAYYGGRYRATVAPTGTAIRTAATYGGYPVGYYGGTTAVLRWRLSRPVHGRGTTIDPPPPPSTARGGDDPGQLRDYRQVERSGPRGGNPPVMPRNIRRNDVVNGGMPPAPVSRPVQARTPPPSRVGPAAAAGTPGAPSTSRPSVTPSERHERAVDRGRVKSGSAETTP